jgi:hypothetical protein
MMNIIECSKQLQALTKAHAHYTISLEEYLQNRKALLDELDLNINGIAIEPKASQQEAESVSVAVLESSIEAAGMEEQQDKTQPYFAGKLGQCMSFIKGSNN